MFPSKEQTFSATETPLVTKKSSFLKWIRKAKYLSELSLKYIGGIACFALLVLTPPPSAKEDGGVIVDAKTKTAKELFTVEYSKDGKTSIKAASGKYLSAKPLGGVDAKAVEVTPKEQFTMQILNRPLLVLQTSSASFVGTAEGKVKTNKATPEVLLASYADGKYVIKASSGKVHSIYDMY